MTYRDELKKHYENPIVDTGVSTEAWMAIAESGQLTDARVMSLLAERDDLRAEAESESRWANDYHKEVEALRVELKALRETQLEPLRHAAEKNREQLAWAEKALTNIARGPVGSWGLPEHNAQVISYMMDQAKRYFNVFDGQTPPPISSAGTPEIPTKGD